MEGKKQEKDEKYEDWLRRIREASGLDQEGEDRENKQSFPSDKSPKKDPPAGGQGKSKEESSRISLLERVIIFLILAGGIAYRLFFIFFVSDPQNAGVGWYGDTYHRWQIGYLTYTTGLSHGFLRLWDLKGMEFFWGPLHPLLLSLIFWITGNTTIVIPRIISLFFGIGSIFLLFLLAKRYFSLKVGLATLFFGAFFPIAVFNDVTGSLEPIGVFFLLLGLYFWPSQPLLTGFSFAASTMVRAEAWLFALGLLFGIGVTREDLGRKIATMTSFALIMLIYMKYLLNYTGNAIYPVWWNFLANGTGAWAGEDPLTSLQMTVKPMLMVLGVLSALVLVFILYRKPRSMLLLLLGFGNIFFVTAFIGFGHYIRGWEWWFPVVRFFVFPYIFLAMLLFLGLSKIKIGKSPIWAFIFVILVALITATSQWTWKPIMVRFGDTVSAWEGTKRWGVEVGKYYRGGTLLFPEGDPHFTYAVVQYGGVHGKNILGQMFDPFFYIGEDSAFDEWGRYRKTVLSWLSKNNVKLAVVRRDTTRYQELIKREKKLFEKVGELEGGVYEIWRVYPERIKLPN